jgi:nucleolin
MEPEKREQPEPKQESKPEPRHGGARVIKKVYYINTRPRKGTSKKRVRRDPTPEPESESEDESEDESSGYDDDSDSDAESEPSDTDTDAEGDYPDPPPKRARSAPEKGQRNARPVTRDPGRSASLFALPKFTFL